MSSGVSQYWWVGVCIALVGSLCSALGLNLQKKAHNAANANGTNVFKSKLWITGLGLIILNSILDIPTFALVPASIVGSLGAVVLVYNIFLAPFVLKEKIGRKDIISTLIIVFGTTISLIFGTRENESYNSEQTLLLFIQPASIVYEAFVILFLISLSISDKIIATKEMNNRENSKQKGLLNEEGKECDGVESEVVVPTLPVVAVETIKNGGPIVWQSFRKNQNGLILAIMGGCLGGESVLFMKIVMSLLTSLIAGESNCFADWPIYLYVTILGTILFFQMRSLNLALSCADSLIVVPTYQVSYILFSIITGASFYSEFAKFSVVQAIMFPIGILITIFGIFLLSKRKPEEKEEDAERVEPEPSPRAAIGDADEEEGKVMIAKSQEVNQSKRPSLLLTTAHSKEEWRNLFDILGSSSDSLNDAHREHVFNPPQLSMLDGLSQKAFKVPVTLRQ